MSSPIDVLPDDVVTHIPAPVLEHWGRALERGCQCHACLLYAVLPACVQAVQTATERAVSHRYDTFHDPSSCVSEECPHWQSIPYTGA